MQLAIAGEVERAAVDLPVAVWTLSIHRQKNDVADVTDVTDGRFQITVGTGGGAAVAQRRRQEPTAHHRPLPANPIIIFNGNSITIKVNTIEIQQIEFNYDGIVSIFNCIQFKCNHLIQY